LLFLRQGTLFAQGFDVERLELRGNPVPVAEHVAFDPLGYAAVATSAAGSLVYRTGSVTGRRQFVWFDRSGAQIGTLGAPDDASALNPSLSPDGRRVALSRSESEGRGTPDIWILDTARGVLNRFTSDPGQDIVPIWSPDGGRIVFNAIRSGPLHLYEKAATGTGREEPLLTTTGNKTPSDWSPDGRFLLYHVGTSPGFDIWALPMNGDRTPFPLAQTKFNEQQGQFSPDGKWIAYQSDETGRFEI
jgi:WD40 repeat protein